MISSMRHIVLLISFILLCGLADASKFDLSGCGIAFYYKKQPPQEMIKLYDYIVVDPDNIKEINKKFIAYLSVGEIEPYRRYFDKMKKEWMIGKNTNWNTQIADTTNKDYLIFLNSLIDEYHKKGFSGIFLDTLDSYQSVIKDKEKQLLYEKSLRDFIKDIRKKYPNFYIIANRGFEFINEELKDSLDAVVAESFLTTYDFATKRYKDQSEEGKNWLLNHLRRIKSYGINVIVIDYTLNRDKDKRRTIAKEILKYGFIPFVSNIELSSFGLGKCEYHPRKILTINSKEISKDLKFNNAFRLYSVPLEYYGYITELIDPSESPLPEETIDEYAGIIVSPEVDVFKNENSFFTWIKKQINDGMKVLFINYFGFDLNEERQQFLGLKVRENTDNPNTLFNLVFKKDYSDFETKINLSRTSFLIYLLKGEPVVKLENSQKQPHIPIAITDWGGYAISESAYLSFPEEMWIIDPFRFFKEALRLKDIPAPDVTTENGRRIFFSHLDGDGFTEVALFDKKRYASEIIRDEIFKKYDLPFTVSIIEGEIAPYGSIDNKTKKFEEIARSIFKLSNVEIANHSYSHPFKWQKIEKAEKTQAYNLKIEGYDFNITREVFGSTEYINKVLAPENKKTKVFLWTGDCNPTENAVKLTYEAGLLNLNGGGTTMTAMSPYITRNFPIGIKKGDYYQIFAPNQNENVYTNLWTSNFYGFKNVIQTFQLTDRPKRLKPINVYYHFYSGSKLSSLNAVKEAYNYALREKITPMFASDYIKRALSFYDTVIAKDIIDDSWIIKTNEDLRTVKIPKNELYPIIDSDIVGFSDYNDMRYIHLSSKTEYKLTLTNEKITRPYLKETNGIIKYSARNGNNQSVSIYGYVPIEVVISNAAKCKMVSNKKFIQDKMQNDTTIKFSEKEVTFEIQCP